MCIWKCGQGDVHINGVQVVTNDKILSVLFSIGLRNCPVKCPVKEDIDKGCCLVFVNSVALFSH